MKFVTGYTNHFHSKIFRKENEVIVKVRRYEGTNHKGKTTDEPWKLQLRMRLASLIIIKFYVASLLCLLVYYQALGLNQS